MRPIPSRLPVFPHFPPVSFCPPSDVPSSAPKLCLRWFCGRQASSSIWCAERSGIRRGGKRRGTPERSSPGSSELFLIYLWLESGRVHAGSDLSFCPRSPSGGRHTQQVRPCHVGRCAPVVALCPGGNRTIRILQKSKRYNISFQGIKGNKNSAPQKSAEKTMCVNRCLHFVYL